MLASIQVPSQEIVTGTFRTFVEMVDGQRRVAPIAGNPWPLEQRS